MNNVVWKSGRPTDDIIEVTKGDGLVPPLLHDLLVCASPHGLEQFIINKLPFKKEGRIDEKGNFIIKVGDNPTTMFSCHMDTVHTVPKYFFREKIEARIWLITRDPDKTATKDTGFIWGAIKTMVGKTSNIKWEGIALGADDKTGVYIMSEMIDHEIPGLYVFHVGEECGGLGSKWIAVNKPELVKGIQRCIAFDRANYGDVIEFQNPGRCASSEFTTAVANAINAKINVPDSSFQFKGGVRGTFTDSASYRELIPECINLSIGYFNQHGDQERQDVYWLTNKLLPALLQVSWDDLPVKRDPKEKFETRTYYHDEMGYEHYGAHNGNTWGANRHVLKPQHVTRSTPDYAIPAWNPDMGILLEATHEGMTEIIRKYLRSSYNPLKLADYIYQLMLERDEAIFELDLIHQDDKGAEHTTEEVAKAAEVKDTELQLPLLPPPSQISPVASLINQKERMRDEDITAEGLPNSQIEMDRRLKLKMTLIDGIVNNRGQIKLTGKVADTFHRNQMRYSKISANIKGHGTANKNIYIMINRILVGLLGVIGDTTDNVVISDNLLRLWMEGMKHIKDYGYEPGIKTEVRV